jgi:hypothetical protein
VDNLIRLRSNNKDFYNPTKSELLNDLDLREFNNQEEIDKTNLTNRVAREESQRKMKIYDKDGNEIILSPIQKFKAISWAITHFLWLYKITKLFRQNKMSTEEQPIIATMKIISQVVKIWLLDILKNVLLTANDKVMLDCLNDNIKNKGKLGGNALEKDLK